MNRYDVIVVGCGPGGAIAGRSARMGLLSLAFLKVEVV